MYKAKSEICVGSKMPFMSWSTSKSVIWIQFSITDLQEAPALGEQQNTIHEKVIDNEFPDCETSAQFKFDLDIGVPNVM